MRTLFFIALIGVCFVCKHPLEEIKGVAVFHVFPWMNNQGKLEAYEKDTTLVYYFQEMVCYKLKYQSDSVHISFLERDSRSSLIKREIKYQYFVMNLKARKGYLFDPENRLLEGWYDFDSIIGNRDFWMNSMAFYHFFSKCHIVQFTTVAKDENSFSEKYEAYPLHDSTQKFTIFLDFSKTFPLRYFSLSPELDSIKNAKLVRTRILNNKRFFKEHNIFIDSFESNNYEISEFPVTDVDALRKYFKRFQELN